MREVLPLMIAAAVIWIALLVARYQYLRALRALPDEPRTKRRGDPGV